MRFEFPKGDSNLQIFVKEFERVFSLYQVSFMADTIYDPISDRWMIESPKRITQIYKSRVLIMPPDNSGLNHGMINLFLGENNKLLAINISGCTQNFLNSCTLNSKVYNVNYTDKELRNPNYNLYSFYI